MRTIHLIVFVSFSILTESKYRFRFYTCNQDDQKALESENLNSLRQVAFIDDGSLVYHNISELDEMGIRILGATALEEITGKRETGSESAIRVISMRDEQNFIVINFWMQSYYYIQKDANHSLDFPITKNNGYSTPLRPTHRQFIRVYFICAPGNSRSALILFGGQSNLRWKRSAKDLRRRKSKRLEMKQKMDKRLEWRAKLYLRAILAYIHFGFSLSIAFSGIILIIYMKRCTERKPVQELKRATKKIKKDDKRLQEKKRSKDLDKK